MDEMEFRDEKIVITSRDIELFRWLNEQKYMASKQIYDIFWPDNSVRAGAGRQRLEKLQGSGYVRMKEIGRRYPRLFLITRKGIDLLKEKGCDHGLEEVKNINPKTIEHNLKLVNLRDIFSRLGAKNWKSERLIWRDEERPELVPDACFESKRVKFALELENGIKAKADYEQKFNQYVTNGTMDIAIFVFDIAAIKSWLMDFESIHHKIGFVLYKDLIEKKGEALFENKITQTSVKEILG